MKTIEQRQELLVKATLARKYGIGAMLSVLGGCFFMLLTVGVSAPLGSIFGAVAVAAFIASPVFFIMSFVQSFLASGVLKRAGEPGGGLLVAGWIGAVSFILSWFPLFWVGHIVYLVMIFTNVNRVIDDNQHYEMDLIVNKN